MYLNLKLPFSFNKVLFKIIFSFFTPHSTSSPSSSSCLPYLILPLSIWLLHYPPPPPHHHPLLPFFSSEELNILLDMESSNDDLHTNSQEEEEQASMEKKYGGIAPKKKPLISKDNKRAYFDSADWALGKQESNVGLQNRVPVEPLKPKLQRTPHNQLPPRRPTCTSGAENRA
ncbi:putative endosulphine [Dioscorea sansibarensis]